MIMNPDDEKIKTDIGELDSEFGDGEQQQMLMPDSAAAEKENFDVREEQVIADKSLGEEQGGAENFEQSGGTQVCEQADANGRAEQLPEQLNELASRMKTLETMFQTKIMTDRQKDGIIDSMHDELQKYKDDMYARIFKPLLADVIYVKEDMRRLIRGIKAKDDAQQNQKLISVIEGYCLDLNDILEKYDVNVFDCGEGKYTPVKQKIIKVVPTDDSELDGMVKERLSDGYELGGRVIFQQRTIVYKFDQKDGGDNNG